ncbi:MAG: hypothetical protein AAF383_04040 [Cyanobacteria bacterium P01_A01_bin.83]
MPVYNITRIIPEPEDNRDTFGAAIAINQKYLAVGDYEANRVIIYTRDNSGQWNRSKQVLPPKNSLPERVGLGFGEQVQLEEDFLIVTAHTTKKIKNVTNPEEFTRIGGGDYIFDERYLVNLEDLETEPKAVGMPMQKSEGLVTFNLLKEGKMTKVTLPDRGEAQFGASFAHYKNLLLVGSPSAIEERGAWLYNLDELDKEPEKLAAPNIYLGNTVALNESFAVVGERDYHQGCRIPAEDVPNKPKSTLIRVNETGSTRTHQFRGRVSLSGNILAIMHPTGGDFVNGAVVEVYSLSSAGAGFLFMRGNVANAFVQNGFLVTVLNNRRPWFYEIHIQELVWN